VDELNRTRQKQEKVLKSGRALDDLAEVRRATPRGAQRAEVHPGVHHREHGGNRGEFAMTRTFKGHGQAEKAATSAHREV